MRSFAVSSGPASLDGGLCFFFFQFSKQRRCVQCSICWAEYGDKRRVPSVLIYEKRNICLLKVGDIDWEAAYA